MAKKIFDNSLKFIELEELRNKIHPYSLKEVDDKYSKNEINNIFAMTSKIIERIENY